MLPRPPSLQSEIDFISAIDDALVQPPAPLPDNAPPADVAAYDAAVAEHERKLVVARETGDYSALLIAGRAPSKLTLRPIPAAAVRKLHDKQQSNSFGAIELLGLAFRLAVSNIPGVKIKMERNATYGLIATPALLDEVRADVVNEVGLYAWQRANGIGPHR